MSIGNKLLARMAAKIKTAGLTCRQDLAVTDYQGIEGGRRVGQVVLSYNQMLKPPSGKEIEEFFMNNFGNAVQANLDTVKIHKDIGAVSVVATTQLATRPITDADGPSMTRLTPLSYVDANTSELWDVTSDEAGRRFMIRQSSDNLADIIEARRLRSRTAPKLASAKIAGLDMGVGDRVSFYDNGIVAYGEVSDLDGATVGIKAATGPVRVSKEAILKVIAKGEAGVADGKRDMKKYFEEAFGDAAYAAELTEETTKK